MEQVTVKLSSRSYEVRIGGGLLEKAGEEIAPFAPGGRVALVSDDRVDQLYGDRTAASLEKAGLQVSRFTFPEGESSKNMTTYCHLLEFLARQRLTRADCVAALGGGVTGDLAGFAAATYLRGIALVQLPTTLLAAVDSSVGGKTGVDLEAGKNLAGAFCQPRRVLCDTHTLSTLTPETFADGMAEVIKYGAILDRELLELLEQRQDEDPMEVVIRRCVALKGMLVERDERDTGDRQLLNFGHTVGHAIEKRSGYTITHGSAVAMGMAVMARACWKNGFSKDNCAPRLEWLLKRYHLPTRCPYSLEELVEGMLSDKKRGGNRITLVAPMEEGRCVLHPVPVDELEAFLQPGMEG